MPGHFFVCNGLRNMFVNVYISNVTVWGIVYYGREKKKKNILNIII